MSAAKSQTSEMLNEGRASRLFRWRQRLHAALVAAHRYLGLTIVVVLLVECVTGSIAVFRDEFDALLNPQLSYIDPVPAGTEPIDSLVLRETVERDLPPGVTAWEVPLTPPAPGRSVELNLNWDDTAPAPRFDTVYVNPFTGELIGTRNYDIRASWRNIIPFLFLIHHSLAMEDVGYWLLGVTAVLWTIDCFIALYLTFPRPLATSTASSHKRGWFSRWKPSWLVRTNSLFGAIFTFHRAGGLWVWPLLLIFAWSSVALRMASVYEGVNQFVFTNFDYKNLPELPSPRWNPKLSWSEALVKCQAYMEAESKERGFEIIRPYIFSHEPDFGFYRYQVQSSLDPTDRWCDTTVRIDSDTGEFVNFWAPTGMDAGHTFTTWIVDLHFGWVGGLGFRILIFVVGIIGSVLCVTGVLIWWRKLRIRARRNPSTVGWKGWARLGLVDVVAVAIVAILAGAWLWRR